MGFNTLYLIKYKLFQYCILMILFTGYGTIVFAQSEAEKGLPFITNYLPKNYKALPQTWCAIKDYRGILYFGIQNGILEYDGVKWNKVIFKNSNPVVIRSLA